MAGTCSLLLVCTRRPHGSGCDVPAHIATNTVARSDAIRGSCMICTHPRWSQRVYRPCASRPRDRSIPPQTWPPHKLCRTMQGAAGPPSVAARQLHSSESEHPPKYIGLIKEEAIQQPIASTMPAPTPPRAPTLTASIPYSHHHVYTGRILLYLPWACRRAGRAAGFESVRGRSVGVAVAVYCCGPEACRLHAVHT